MNINLLKYPKKSHRKIINLPKDSEQLAEFLGATLGDGCLYVHKHYVKSKLYKNIGFCFTSYSNALIDSVTNILKKFNLNTHITDNHKRIYFYSKNDVEKYLNIFGSSNPRIYQTYNNWRDVRAV